MDKVIVTALLIMAGVISVVGLFNTMYPLIGQSADAMANMERRTDDRMKTQIQILHAAPSGANLFIWIKNVGSSRIMGIDSSDLFFGPQGNFARIPFGSGTPHWEYIVENSGTDWNPTGTIKVIVYNAGSLSGRYFTKFVLSNGISDESYFSW